MTLKQLEYFLAIAENGSITKAANSLRISQPPLSLQLKGLEEELGVTLLSRNRGGVTLTGDGRALLPQIQLLRRLGKAAEVYRHQQRF